jgi:hypothetical protein
MHRDTGVPSGLRYMPGLLDAVKGAVQREAAQLFDKMQYVASKVRTDGRHLKQIPGVRVVRRLCHFCHFNTCYSLIVFIWAETSCLLHKLASILREAAVPREECGSPKM